MKISVFTKCFSRKYVCLILTCFAVFCHSYSAFTQDEFIITGDTLILELKDTSGYKIQWQIRGDSFSSWRNIPGATINPFAFSVPDSLEGLAQLRAKLIYFQDSCPQYSNVFKYKIRSSLLQLPHGSLLRGGYFYHSTKDFALIAATVPTKSMAWGCYGQEINGGDLLGIGDGKQNTLDIVSQCKETNIAAYFCDTLSINNYADWYLPSKEELELLLKNLGHLGIVPPNAYNYWSSSEFSKSEAWYFALFDSVSYKHPKSHLYNYVHPVRQFNLKTDRTLKINFMLVNLVDQRDIIVQDLPNKSNNVLASFVGEGKETDNYIWDFGKNSTIVTGTGKGPFEISYNFGGYNRISVINTNEGCMSAIYYSDYFRKQVFEDIKPGFPPIYRGCFDWGDYNNDGLLDILMTGSENGKIYKNQNNDSFVEISQQLPKLKNSSADWGDFNNDNFLDFAIAGVLENDSTLITKVFQNVRNDSFVELLYEFPGIQNGFVKWFDKDNDGKLELLISGENTEKKPLTKIYTNFASGIISEVPSKLVNLKNSNGSFADYNKDGFIDLILIGNDGVDRRTIIYKNENGNFVGIPSSITDIEYGSVAWGDYDNDGLLDFAISGAKDSIGIKSSDGGNTLQVNFGNAVYTGIYKQEKNDSFNYKIGFDFLENYAISTLDWGDYDNDGFIDIAIAGVPKLSYVSVSIGGGLNPLRYPSTTKILRNNKNHSFPNQFFDIPAPLSNTLNNHTSEVIEHEFSASFIAFGDYNADGKLDFIREGTKWNTTIYKNNISVENKAPNIPSKLEVIPTCEKANLHWTEATDDHTPNQCITYEIYVGTAPGKCDVFSKVNSYKIRNNTFELNNLQPGTYYWSVKAVDQAQSASAWAPEQSFTIYGKPTTPVISLNGNVLHSTFAIGNQWHNQNGPISGATQQDYIPSLNGTYYTLITDHQCTSDTSNKIEVIVSGDTRILDQTAFTVMPNPANKYLNVNSPFTSQTVSYKITDIHGRELLNGLFKDKANIQIESLSKGSYFITFESVKMKEVFKFLKE
ncbi:MAG: VCBS repeat-containing protein [Saprospiraceae bacterium]|nr:VCBS repeat-containing protein [Saprospiraceae bacterium]